MECGWLCHGVRTRVFAREASSISLPVFDQRFYKPPLVVAVSPGQHSTLSRALSKRQPPVPVCQYPPSAGSGIKYLEDLESVWAIKNVWRVVTIRVVCREKIAEISIYPCHSQSHRPPDSFIWTGLFTLQGSRRSIPTNTRLLLSLELHGSPWKWPRVLSRLGMPRRGCTLQAESIRMATEA